MMTSTKGLDPKGLTYLEGEGFPRGLIDAMVALKKDCAEQIFVIDNSEPMNQPDGHILSKTNTSDGNKLCFEKATRWEELKMCVKSHIQIAGALKIPASFRLLNTATDGAHVDGQEFSIGQGKGGVYDVDTEVQTALEIMDKIKPHSRSPLTKSILQLLRDIESRKEEIKKRGKHVSVVLCTDGVPSDSTREFLVDQLKKILGESLPVHMVVRLCTDEPSVVDFYNDLDKDLNIRLDVLDDFQGEALEICKINPWLTYSLPLHRAREMGFNSPCLDNLDEGPLSKTDQKELCDLLFGKDKMYLSPSPELDPEGFLDHVKTLQQDQTEQWVRTINQSEQHRQCGAFVCTDKHANNQSFLRHYRQDPIMEETKPWIDVDLVKNPKEKMAKMRRITQKKKGKWFAGVLGIKR
ncbi:expressed unknown protein [Seminavis robusta]|uniref:VWFA domain-containing protein n=1 Tax=Seminavis robusta TaxID=568900 RepID=A0A9N8EWN4_9STRA|nr:expressed unknown protein [Seminavis robusta]|eukprot:Sro2241_g320390.1 n/a (409) ;mRNA; r:12509-13735